MSSFALSLRRTSRYCSASAPVASVLHRQGCPGSIRWSYPSCSSPAGTGRELFVRSAFEVWSSCSPQAWVNFSDLAREKQDSYPRLMTAAISMSPKISYPEWQQQYQTALLELDREKLPERVAAAETAIYERLQAISRSSDYQAERQAIEDALASLRVLKRNSLEFPD